jgi:exodeoxyribonuclease VII small subunit
MDKEKAISFETALEKLEKAADNLKNDSLTLDDALKNYEEGIAYYKKCEEILQQAKQKIETYSK